MSLDPATLRSASDYVAKMAKHFIECRRAGDAIMYEQGIGCERASNMLKELADLQEKPGTPPPTPGLRQPESRSGSIRRMILEMEEIERLYMELLYSVARAFPGESRHQTALRYIQQAEANAVSGPACEATKP